MYLHLNIIGKIENCISPTEKGFSEKVNIVKISVNLSNLYTFLMSILEKKLKSLPWNSENGEGIITAHHNKFDYNT